MLRILKNRTAKRGEGDEGFTLIELMVVVMIIAVLLAIAIPTFLGSQNKAKERSAQSSLRNTVTAAKTIYTDTNDYTKVNDAALTAGEPSLDFVELLEPSEEPKTVAIGSTATVFSAAAQAKGGDCFYIRESTTEGTTYGRSDSENCDGTTAAGAAIVYGADGWK